MSKTVIRAGYGIFWLPNNLEFQARLHGPPPGARHHVRGISEQRGIVPFNTLTNPFPNGVILPPGLRKVSIR